MGATALDRAREVCPERAGACRAAEHFRTDILADASVDDFVDNFVDGKLTLVDRRG